jgi:ABC-type Na+ efflux pump permease subunit
MNRRAIRAIVRKDLRVVVQSKAVIAPLIIVPIIMLVVLPGLAGLAPLAGNMAANDMKDLAQFISNMPAGLQAEVADLNEAQTWVFLSLVYFLAPMYLIIPLMVASVIAADSFAGEKERKTLEALLYTPTTDQELFLGKILAAWLPAVAVAWGGFVIYAVVANLSAWPTMGRIFFPTPMWIVLALWVAPAAAGLGLSAVVLVSSRVQTFQEAYQMGSTVVLPVVLLIIGQATGVIYFSLEAVLLLGIVLWIIDAVLLWWGGRSFQRGEIIARL